MASRVNRMVSLTFEAVLDVHIVWFLSHFRNLGKTSGDVSFKKCLFGIFLASHRHKSAEATNT